MKAILEFNDAWGDDALGHKMALNGPRYHSALRLIDEYCRSKLKYGGGSVSKQSGEYLQEIRDLIRSEVSDLDEDA